jgi:hypothetical protein
MKPTAIALLAGLALLCTANLPASAEDHGPPPSGDQLLTPRYVCLQPDALKLAFTDGTAFEMVSGNLQTLAHISVNGGPLCLGVVTFKNPVTILTSTKIGAVVLPDQSEFDAWELHAKFPDGQEIYALWLEMTKDAPKVEYQLKCGNDCV